MTKFNIELDAHGVPRSVEQFAKIIMNHDNSTLIEKQLAYCVIELTQAVNNLVVQLNCGTAVVVVEEPSIDRD